jgi:hypothetical protein
MVCCSSCGPPAARPRDANKVMAWCLLSGGFDWCAVLSTREEAIFQLRAGFGFADRVLSFDRSVAPKPARLICRERRFRAPVEGPAKCHRRPD